LFDLRHQLCPVWVLFGGGLGEDLKAGGQGPLPISIVARKKVPWRLWFPDSPYTGQVAFISKGKWGVLTIRISIKYPHEDDARKVSLRRKRRYGDLSS
jgi:hypothetical protein